MKRTVPHTIFSYQNKLNSSKYPFFLASTGHFNKQTEVNRNTSFWHEFHWITKGSGVYNLDGKNIVLSAGDCIFLKKDYKCRYRVADSDSFYSTSWVAFLGGDEILEKHNFENFKIFKIPPCAERLHGKIIEQCKNGASEAKRSIVCYEFVIELLDTLLRREKDIKGLIKNYIQENFERNITLNDVAEEVGMTANSLCRYLKNNNIDSYVKQLTDTRISNAKLLLETTNYQVSDVGILCGFEDPSYFGKIFKKETGITPLEYRKSQLE